MYGSVLLTAAALHGGRCAASEETLMREGAVMARCIRIASRCRHT